MKCWKSDSVFKELPTTQAFILTKLCRLFDAAPQPLSAPLIPRLNSWLVIPTCHVGEVCNHPELYLPLLGSVGLKLMGSLLLPVTMMEVPVIRRTSYE